jgi:glutamyl-tRNA reductase
VHTLYSEQGYLSDFHLIGISYETADVHTREKYSVPADQQIPFMEYMMAEGIAHGMVISTCNRTELYCFSEDKELAVAQFVACSRGNANEFSQVGFVKSGKEALAHLFRVCAGLESQIPGDFEIVGQAKKAFIQAKKIGFANGILERMVNAAVHGSKRVKNETGFSSGASSVSYATVRFIRDNFAPNAKILLYGLGEIGKVTLENLLKHVPASQITLANRSFDKTQSFAAKYQVAAETQENLSTAIANHQILIVASGAANPVLFPIHFSNAPCTVIDLSVPSNVAEAVGAMPNITLVDVDTLSQITLSNIARRKAYIPQVESIVLDELVEFFKWYHNRTLVPLVDNMKNELFNYAKEIKESEQLMEQDAALAERIINRLAGQIFSSGKSTTTRCPMMMEAFKRRLARELEAAE